MITIYHNPACETSRNVLAMIRNSGEELRIIEYLKTPPARDELVDVIARTGISVRELLRRKGTPYDELGLDDPALTDDQLIDAMLAHPILINRPIVVTPRSHLGDAGHEDAAAIPRDRVAELVGLGAAFAVNCVSSLENYMRHADSAGVTRAEILEIAKLAKFIKERGASHVERQIENLEHEKSPRG